MVLHRLFESTPIREVLGSRQNQMREEIRGFEREYMMACDPDSLCSELVLKYRLDGVPRIYSERKAVLLSSGREPHADIGSPYMRINLVVPFEGDPRFFTYHSSLSSYAPPMITSLDGDHLLISVTRSREQSSSLVERDASLEIQKVQTILDSLARDVDAHNSRLQQIAMEEITAARRRFQAELDYIKAIGIPVIRKRPDAPQAYEVPVVRRRISVQRTSLTAESEVTLGQEIYEGILRIIRNMGRAIELSPRAFAALKEEDLRFHFLVQLNGQYEGEATGETFNGEGKTDILVKHAGRNVFIAECKFWRGRESLMEATDQLLDYLSWHDTKTALIIFNKNRNLTRVVASIPEVMSAHPNYIESIPYPSEHGLRYRFRHKQDPEKHLQLTVLVFDVPVPE